MIRILFGLILAALGGFSQLQAGFSITLYTRFDTEPSRHVRQTIERELDAVMRPAGLRFDWRSLDKASGEASEELAVVLFHGVCSITPLSTERSKTGPLGWTHLTDQEVLPFADVDCDRISAFIRPAVAGLPPQTWETMLGRALARVLAHELFHVLSRTVHHGSAGVARNGHTVQELTAEEFQFEEADLGILAVLRARNRYRDVGATLDEGRFLYSKGGCVSCHGQSGQGSAEAPKLRKSTLPVTLSRLASRLKGKRSEMSRRARTLTQLWRLFEKTDIESLVRYLNTSGD